MRLAPSFRPCGKTNDREAPKPFVFPQEGTRKRGNFSDTRPPTQDRKERREKEKENPTEPEWGRRVSAGSLTIRYTGYLTNPFSKLKSRRPPLYKVQTGQTRKHYFRRSCTGESTSTAERAHGEAHVPLRRKSCVRTEPEGGPTAIKKDSEKTNYGTDVCNVPAGGESQ